MITDTRTEAERRYDTLKDGSAYVRSAEPFPELRAQIDAAPDLATKQRLICRMADQVLGLSDDTPEADELPAEVASGEMSLLQYVARWIDRKAAEHGRH